MFYKQLKSFDVDCSIEFILLNYDDMDFTNLSRYHNLTFEFLAIFQNDLNWDVLSRRNDMTVKIVIMYPDLVSWRGLRHSSLYTKKFQKEFALYTKTSRQF